MSFDIAVTGSLTFSWSILDESGFIIDFEGPFAISAGSSTQTLNFSTANIDPGFDISKVVRSEIWITAASANSRFTVTNYTYAPVPEPATMAALGVGIAALVRRRKKA
jgi:hypothetical protein